MRVATRCACVKPHAVCAGSVAGGSSAAPPQRGEPARCSLLAAPPPLFHPCSLSETSLVFAIHSHSPDAPLARCQKSEAACDKNEIALITLQHIKPAAASATPQPRPPQHPSHPSSHIHLNTVFSPSLAPNQNEAATTLSYLISIICNCRAACSLLFLFLCSAFPPLLSRLRVRIILPL